MNYDFRPDSYWSDESDPLSAILKDVKGTQRREMIKDFWNQGSLSCWMKRFSRMSLMIKRESLGFTPPGMGGEYLPNIFLWKLKLLGLNFSRRRQTSSVYTGEAGCERKIGRIVDEYESTIKGVPETSTKPLTLEELIQLIDYDYNDSGCCG